MVCQVSLTQIKGHDVISMLQMWTNNTTMQPSFKVGSFVWKSLAKLINGGYSATKRPEHAIVAFKDSDAFNCISAV